MNAESEESIANQRITAHEVLCAERDKTHAAVVTSIEGKISKLFDLHRETLSLVKETAGEYRSIRRVVYGTLAVIVFEVLLKPFFS